MQLNMNHYLFRFFRRMKESPNSGIETPPNYRSVDCFQIKQSNNGSTSELRTQNSGNFCTLIGSSQKKVAWWVCLPVAAAAGRAKISADKQSQGEPLVANRWGDLAEMSGSEVPASDDEFMVFLFVWSGTGKPNKYGPTGVV